MLSAWKGSRFVKVPLDYFNTITPANTKAVNTKLKNEKNKKSKTKRIS
jgi:hypothetical protein